jgi:uncharacterized membrane protein
MHYFPLALPFLLILVLGLIFLIALIEVGILRYAYRKIGVGSRHMFTLLFLCLLGSYVNIPVAELPAKEVYSKERVNFFGMQYVVPSVGEYPRTVIAVNLGGAVIPTILSLYLIIKNRLYRRAILAVTLVTYGIHRMAYLVPGIGIGEPIFIPPLLTTAVALLISREYAAPLAYIAGSLGTLIGADLLNLGKTQGLGAPIVSIGGAGTFDGIFVTGILSVLLVGFLTGRKKPPEPDIPHGG